VETYLNTVTKPRMRGTRFYQHLITVIPFLNDLKSD